MYTENDFQEISVQLKKRITVLVIPALLLLAAVIVSFVFRSQLLTTVLSLLMGVYSLFSFSMFIYPVLAYKRHLHYVLHGRVRKLTGAFKEMDETIALRDGVRFYPMLINVGKMENAEDDRLFYYDANLPRPDWQVGDMITITSHDKAVGAWEKA